MIETIRLRNFKCFEDQTLLMGPLTLLSGQNGTGKSSAIQSLLLLRQSWQQGLLEHNQIALNGDLVEIGRAKDALYSYAELQWECLACGNVADEALAVCPKCGSHEWDEGGERIGLEVSFQSKRNIGLSLKYDKNADVLSASRKSTPYSDLLKEEGVFSSAAFQYLCAERIGPRTSSATSDFVVQQGRQLGSRGQYTSHFLSLFGREQKTAQGLLRSDAVANNLAAQVEAWLDFIAPGTRIKLTAHPTMDLIQVQYSFVTGMDVTDDYRPTNVGFGLSYTLPILVAVLSAQPGSLLLLENPEAHLHPRGQSKMGAMLAQAAMAGIQVVIETHSDHVLNGIRIAVREGKLPHESVRLHFFERTNVDGRSLHRVHSPVLDSNGRVSAWPPGFFDEWDDSLRRLLKPQPRQ